MELNEVTRRLPKHLLQFVVDQPYSAYTPIDQAVWRYVMRRNCRQLKAIAHASYLSGLEIAGVEIDRIPTMYGMNRILKEIGWAAVAVDGFIPPGAFMEFTQYNVLVIAADIRTLEHIEYTPAPDIIHESAGHAPIIAVPEFAAYLRAIGEAGAKAFSSKKDVELYEAIRHLSIIKEDPATKAEDILTAERDIEIIQQNMGEPSEMALIRNLHWWTVEYGLIGTPDNYKLYGAGLLSSIGEAVSCLKDNVKKIPYSIDAMHCNYDITKPQPQLFVTPDFPHLMKVLETFKQQMAWSRGGLFGIQKAIESQHTSTLVFSSGLQVTGTVSDVVAMDGEPVFVRTDGPTALAFENRQLAAYGKDRLTEGFASPIGDLTDNSPNNTATTLSLEDLSDSDLHRLKIKIAQPAELHYQSGIVVEGVVQELLRSDNGKLLLIRFADASIRFQNKILWQQSPYILAVGSKIISAFAGPADADAYEPLASVPREKMHKIQYDEAIIRLQKLYDEVRRMREDAMDIARLKQIFQTVQHEYKNDWLLPLEILELLEQHDIEWALRQDIRNHLQGKAIEEPNLSQLIWSGLALLDNGEEQVANRNANFS